MSRGPRVLNVWVSPGKPCTKAESGVTYPAGWPAAAVICQSDWQKDHWSTSNATLFLVAGEDFDAREPLKNIIEYTLYVSSIKSPATGQWYDLGRRCTEFFFIVTYSRQRLQVFSHEVSFYNMEQTWREQDHYFEKVFDADTYSMYVGDIDGDAVNELLIGIPDTTKPSCCQPIVSYDIYRWEDTEMVRVGQVTPEEVLEKQSVLTSIWDTEAKD